MSSQYVLIAKGLFRYWDLHDVTREEMISGLVTVLREADDAGRMEERERCAKIAEGYNDNDELETVTRLIAADIRGG